MAQSIVVPSGDRLEFPDGMPDSEIEKAIHAEYPDLAPKPSLMSRAVTALKPAEREPMPSTADTINAGWTSPPEETLGVPGSVMDGYAPRENDQGMPVEAGMGPMRKDYYDQTRAGLLSAPVEKHAAAAKAGGQVGKIAAESLPARVVANERAAAGDTQARTMQELGDQTNASLTAQPLRTEATKEANRQWLTENSAGAIEGIKRFTKLDQADAEAELQQMIRYGVKPSWVDSSTPDATLMQAASANIGATGPALQKALLGLSEAAADQPMLQLPWMDYAKRTPRQLEMTVTNLDKQIRAARNVGGKIEAGSWNDVVSTIGPSLATNMPPLIAAALVAAKNPAAGMAIANGGLGVMGMQKFGDNYLKGQMKGLSAADNLTQASLGAAAEVIPEKLSLNSLFAAFKTLGKGSAIDAVKAFAKQQLTEHSTEQITTIADHLIDKAYTEPNKSIESLWSEMKQTAMATAIQAPLLAAGGAAAHITGQAVVGAKQRFDENRDITAGMQFDPGQIDAAARQALDPANAQMRQVGTRAAPVPPRASTRAELDAILASDKPVAEILAAQAPAAPQATPQAPLQPAAFGWPDIKTPAVATLPDGQIITGQIAGIQDSDGQPMARFVGADGQVWMLQPGEADIKLAPAGDGTRTAPVQAETAEHIKIAEQQVDTDPTEKMKEAGNYQLGHLAIQGLDIAIENPAGSVRSGVDKAGKPWSNTINHTYGYIKGATAADGDKLDAFIGPDPQSQQVFVIDQIDPDTGRYDEAKTMLGFNSLDEARAAYLSNYDAGWKGVGAITPLSMPAFKAWIAKGETHKPLAYDQKAAIAERKAAADTQKAGEAYAAEREKAVAAIGEDQVAAIEDQVADQNAGQPTIELYRAIATALKAEAARQATKPAAPAQTPAAPSSMAQPEPVAAAPIAAPQPAAVAPTVEWAVNKKAKSETLAYINGELMGGVFHTRSPGTSDWGWKGMESRELHFTQEKAMSVEREAVLKRYERALRNRALDAATSTDTPTSTPPATPKQLEMKARAAKNIDAYLNQNAAGRWQLSQPIDDADLRGRVIDEMDRRNQGEVNAAQAAQSPVPAVPQEARQGAPLPEQIARQAKPNDTRFVIKRDDVAGDKVEWQGKSATGEWQRLTTFDTIDAARAASRSQGYGEIPVLESTWNAKAKRFSVPKEVAGAGATPIVTQQSDKAIAAPTQDKAPPAPEERAYTKGQAEVLARRMTNQGLPSEAYPHPTQDGMWAIRVPGEEQPADAGADFLASNRAEFRHEGFRIYPISIKGEPRWAVQSLDNSEKEKKGERQIGGDAIVDTPDQAKQQAESQVTERGQKAEDRRQFAEHAAAEEAKKEANRGLSITQRRANAALDKPTNLPVNAGVGRGTRREAMESAVSQERAITAVDVRDTAAYKRDEDEQGRLHRAGYGAFFGNDSHPQKMRFNELSAKLKNRDNYQKKEYRLYMGRDTEGSFYDITKTEYDYAQTLIAAKKAEPITQTPSTPTAKKEPWQYGELEYGDKYIDEVVLPQLRKDLENAHGGKFQEYKSKAAAVRGLKERIDTLENHRDAKARKYYASLDNHYGAVRAALADGKSVPPVAYESYDDLKADVSAGRIKGDGQEVARVEQPAALKDIIAKREAEVEAVNQDYAAKYAGLQKELGKLNSSITVVKGKTEKRAAINEQAGDLRRSSEQQIRDILNRYHEIIKDHPEELARRAESSRKTREMKAEIAAQHIEAGQAEPATAPVIAASIKESAKNTPMNIEQAREWLLKQIDAAMIDAKSAKEEDVWDRAEGKVDLKGRMDVKETIGYKVFDVPGDGRFSVLNLKESLQKFKKQVAATPGFKKNATRPMSVANGSGGKTSVRDMLEDGEYVLAVDYGRLIGEPLLFGAVRKGEAHPIAYTNAEPVDIKGIEAQVGREWNVTGKAFSWRVIETTTGVSVSSETTKERAVSKAKAYVDEHGADKLIAQINETPKVSQSELERQFTDWGSEEEAKAQKTRDAVERADTEDRALWNSIFTLKDGEKRSPNPWNDIDHKQVVILAQDAVKAGKGDEFVSLIERRRGGTNNMLALAARKALADAAPKAKPAKGSIATGVASKILGDIYQRAAYNKWTWDRLKSYLTREMEEAGVGKSRMANALEKAMTEYARTANGRLGYPNSNLVFSAMRDYGLIAEESAGAAKAEQAKGYPSYSNNKLFNAEGTAELPKDWIGVARSDSGKRFFYLGQENGERSFNPLKAESYEDALKEAEGLKNDKPVIPEGYREVARGYFGGTVEKPIYAPFSEGERVRFIGGHAGQIQSFIGGPVTTGAIIKYDNGLTGRAEWRDVEAVKKPAAAQEPKNFKSIDALNAANNPLGEDDWIRFADGSEWQVKGRMNGWVLMQGKTEHPTVKNIMGQVPLIRAVIEANDAAQKPKEPAFDVDAEGGHSWNVIKAHSEWVKLAKNQWHYRFEGMGQGVVIDTHAEEGRSGENKWRTSDGELHVGLAEAKAHEIETHAKPKLIENGYLNEAAPKEAKEPAQGAEKVGAGETATAEESSGVAKISDFGEKIGGARKDVWSGYKDKLNDAESVDIKAEPLSKSWPAPDYQALIDAGADPWGVAFSRAARDEIPRKPSASWKLKSWVANVALLRGITSKLMNGEISADKAQLLLAEASKTSRGLADIAGRVELYMLVGHRQSLDGVSISVGQYGVHNGIHYDKPKTIWSVSKEAAATAWSNWPRELAIGDTRKEAMDNFKAAYDKLDITPAPTKAATFDIYIKFGESKYLIGKKVGRNHVDLAGPFDTVKEARAYRTEHEADLAEKLEKFKEIPKLRRDVNQPRVGEDMRGGADVTQALFAETFGFKGVEFGNWVEQARRQKDLNDAFDALMDMAAVLGVPPKALSLNGELGLAFGARGTGGIDAAAAHYEADKIVINLTKKSGEGSLGHEFFHALDNYFSRKRGKAGDFTTEALDVSLAGRNSPYHSDGLIRKEMIEAFGAVMRAIRSTALKARSSKLDAKRSKEYWTTDREMAARAFESYLISKLHDNNASNDYLSNIVDEATWKAAEAMGFELEESYPYPTAGEVPAIRAGFDHFFKTIETKETDTGIAFNSLEDDHQSAVSRAIDRAIAQESEQPAETQRGAGWLKIKLRQAQHKGDLSAKAVEMVEWLIKQNPALVKYLAVAVENPKGLKDGDDKSVVLESRAAMDTYAKHSIDPENVPVGDWAGRTIFHGTSDAGADSIHSDGVIIDKSTGGYFGVGFYAATDANLAANNYADFAEENDLDGKGSVIAVRIKDTARILDLRDGKDWEAYQKADPGGRGLSLRDFAEKMTRQGIDGLFDRSFGGVVIYNPKAIEVLPDAPISANALESRANQPTTGAAGNYNPFTQVMTLFRGNASDTTAIHEILHHLERMMPAEMQAEIRKEWLRAVTGELQKATKAKDQKRIDYFTAVLAGDQKKATELLTGKRMEGFNAPALTSTVKIGRAFSSLVTTLGKDDVSELLMNWNDSELSDDGTKIILFPGRDRRYSAGELGGSLKVGKGEFLSWLHSDAPLDPSVFEVSDEWRTKVEAARNATGLNPAQPEFNAVEPAPTFKAVDTGLDDATPDEQFDAVARLAESRGWNILSRDSSNVSNARYMRIEKPTEYDPEYGVTEYEVALLRFSGHANRRVTADVLDAELDLNVAPGADIFSDAMQQLDAFMEAAINVPGRNPNDLAIGQDYQYLNPSEFWAVRMTNAMAARFEAKSIWARSLQWLREALEHIKGALGLKSDHPLLKALDDLIARGTGEFVSKEMLGSSEVYASIEESGPEEVAGVVMRDVSLAARLLLHPRQIAANHKPFVPVFDTAIKQFEERDRIVSGLGEMAKPYFELTHAQRLNVNKIVEQGRLDRTVYTVADLENGIHHAESGDLVTLDAEEIGAYKALRRTFNEALSLFRDTMLEEFGFAELIPEAKAAAKLRQMIADGEIEESRIEWARHVAKAIDEIEQAKRTGYAPFNRYGQFVVAVKALPAGVEVQDDDGKQFVTGIPESGDDPLTQIVTDMGGQYDVFRDGWVIDDTRKAVLRALETTLFATKVEVNAFNEWRKQGKDVTAIPEVKAAFDEAKLKYGKAPNARVLAFHITEKAKADDANLSTFDELARISDVDVETWDAVREKLQEAIKAKSFRKHFFGSDNTPGYSVDFERSVADYIIGMSGYLARRKHVKDFDNAIKHIKAPALAKYAEDYRKYVNSPADEFALLKNIGFLYYIAGSTATAVANLTQVPMLTMPTLVQFVPHHIAAREVARAWGEALAMFSPTKTGLQMFDPAKVPADVRDVFKTAWEDQLFVPLETLDLMAASSIKTVGGRKTMRALSVTTQAIAYEFMFAERLNRITTFIAAQRISRMKVAKDRMRDVVKNDAWARHSIGGRAWGERNFAEWVVDESQYRMGKVNRPTVMRGVGSPLLQFKGYMIQTLEAGYRMAVMHGNGGKPAALAALAMMWLLGGIWGTPGLEDLRDMIERLYKLNTGKDLDLKTEVRQLIARTTGSAALAAAANKGIPYATVGVDMSRVGMGNILPDSALQVGGIPVDLAIARPMRAAEKMAAGKTTEAMSEFLPNFIKNPAMGLQWKRDGLRDKYGSRMMTPGEFDYGDVAIKSLGWTPTKVTNRREYTYAESRAERGIDELKRRYTNDLVRAYVHEAEAKDPAEKAEYKADQAKILARIEEHNKTASPENLIKLDPGTLRRKAAAEFSGSAAREGKERKLSRGEAVKRRELFQLR